MAVKPIGTTALTWGSLLGRGNREPIDATQLNYSYTDLLWELNQRTVSYQIGTNNGGSGNYYVGLITAVPYVNEDDKRKDSHYTVDANGNKKLETINMKGPWYVSYKGTDKGRGTAKNKYGFVPDGNPNTYYADRIVLKQEMDYTLDNGFVRKTQLGTYYTGVGHWYDSYTKSKTYANGLECPDGVYFPTTSYAEIFNNYTYNVATGIFSHAEGGSTTASGHSSHAEGGGTTASGHSSHAEGNNTTSSGGSSHAEGKNTKASGNESHAEGENTTASGGGSHAEGISTQSIGQSSHAEGTLSYAGGNESHAEGNNTKANGDSSHAEGGSTTASAHYSHAEGYSTTASGDFSHAEGGDTTASGDHSHAEGYYTKASGSCSHAEGTGTTASGDYSHAEGHYAKASGDYSHAEGHYAEASEDYSHAEGGSTTASGYYSHAEGIGTTASGYYSHAEGSGTTASGYYSHAEGDSTKATGFRSHAEGTGTTASGDHSHAEGALTTASAHYSHAEGYSTYVHSTAENSHAEGFGSYTNGLNAHAENSSYANGKNSHSGGEATADGVNSFAHGVKGTLASGVNSIALVSGTASGSNSIAFTGTASGNSSISLDGTASGSNSVSIQGTAKSTDSVAIGQGAIAETGQGAMALIKGHATGQQSLATNTSSASGTNSVAMNVSSASNTQSFAVNNSTASGINSASTNKGNASGENSISTNISTATGVNSAALNNGNASGEGSVAMNYSQATGKGSVAIGLNTIASGEYSLSHGHETRISGNYSVGLGQGIKVSSNTNVSTGKFNKDEASYFAVGIGISDTNRKNAFWISQGTTAGTNGVSYFSNNTYVYGNTYDPSQYPNNKEDKSWSVAVTYNMYRNSYTYLYNTIDDKFATFGTGTYFTHSIDGLTYTPTTNVFHWKTQIFDKDNNIWPKQSYSFTFTQANHTNAGVMSAEDKRRLDSIKGFTYDNGNTHEYNFNENHTKGDNLHSFHINTDGTIGYTGWTQGFKYTNNESTVTLSYTHYTGNDSSINIPVLNDGNTINQGSANASKAGIVTADQYNKIVSRLTYLEKWCMWQSGLPNNKSTYIWSGTLAQFNSLTSKPENTTFIISN